MDALLGRAARPVCCRPHSGKHAPRVLPPHLGGRTSQDATHKTCALRAISLPQPLPRARTRERQPPQAPAPSAPLPAKPASCAKPAVQQLNPTTVAAALPDGLPAVLPLVGTSSQAVRLRQQVVAAAARRGAVLLLGEAGLRKATLAAAIHELGGRQGGGAAPSSLRVLDAAERSGSLGDALRALVCSGGGGGGSGSGSGSSGDQESSLLVTNVHMASFEDLDLLHEVLSRQAGLSAPEPGCRTAATGADATTAAGMGAGAGGAAMCMPRLLLTSQEPLPSLEAAIETRIQVPPLRARPSDIQWLTQHVAQRMGPAPASPPASPCASLDGGGCSSSSCGKGGCGGKGNCGCSSGPPRATPAAAPSVVLTPAALRQLSSYPFIGNLEELEGMVVRAIAAVRSEGRAPPPVAAAVAGASAAGAHATAAAAAAGATSCACGVVPPPPPLALDAQHFLQARADADRGRIDIFGAAPWLKPHLRILLSEVVHHRLSITGFGLVLAALLLGPQDREHNAALTLFWAGWWPAAFLSFPLAGRVWCSVCPFMAVGDHAAPNPTTGAGGVAGKWQPKWGAWAGPALVAMFAAILVWEEVWQLPNTAHLSAALLLLITAGAGAGSWLWGRRSWCSHLCPIGGMTGLFAKLSMTEVRAQPGICTAMACSRHCISGTPASGGGAPGEPCTEALPGCPVGVGPNHVDNSSCVSCLLCVQNCPNGSAQLRFRFPGIDLFTQAAPPRTSEVALLLMLLGAVHLHRLPELSQQLGLPLEALAASSTTVHIAASLLLLAAPGAAIVGMHSLLTGALYRSGGDDGAGNAGAQRSEADGATACPALATAAPATAGTTQDAPGFNRIALAYMPLVWAATLAHYELPLLTELGSLLPRGAAMFSGAGLGIGPAADVLAAQLPSWSAPPAVVALLQGATLLTGAGGSAVLLASLCSKVYGDTRVRNAHWAMLGAVLAELWHLIV